MADRFRKANVIRPSHVRMARAAVGLSVRELAELAGVNKATIVRLEAGLPARKKTIDSIRKALESKGTRFLVGTEAPEIAVSVFTDRIENH